MSEFVLKPASAVKIEAAVKRNGGSGADIDWLSSGDNFRRMMRLRVEGERGTQEQTHLVVDYRKTLKEMIAAGYYDSACQLTEDDCSFSGTGVVWFEWKLLDYGLSHYAHPSAFEQRTRVEEKGFKPSQIEHLLALGAQYPHKQRERPIAALGSWVSVRGTICTPVLTGFGYGGHQPFRNLELFERSSLGAPGNLFLTVRDIPAV